MKPTKKDPVRGLNAYTDDEILSMADSYGIRSNQQPSYDSYSDDEILGMAQGYGIKPQRTETEQTSPNHFSLGAAVDSLGDVVNRGVERLDKAGIGASGFMASARKAKEQQDAFNYNGPVVGPGVDHDALARMNRGTMSRWAAAGSGALGLVDTAMNAPRWLVNRVPESLGMDGMEYSHLQNDFNNLPFVHDLRQEAPEFFDQYASTAQTMAPIPGRAGELIGGAAGAMLNSSAGRRIADAALTQGLIGGAQAINSKLQQRQQPGFGDVAGGFLGGAALGGLVHGGVEGFSAGINAIGKGAGDLFKRLSRTSGTITPPTAKTIAKGSQNRLSLDAGLLDEDDLAALQMMGQAPGIENISIANKGPTTPEEALANISRLKNGDPALNSLRGLGQQAGANVPGNGKIGGIAKLELLAYPDYLDLEMGASHPRQPEQLQYPQYIDFSQAPKAQFRDVTRGGKYENLGVQLRGLAQRSQSALPAQPKQQRQYPDIDWGRPMPEPQPIKMSGLAYELDNLAGGNAQRLVGSVSQIEIAQAAIRNATPENIDQVISDAVKLVPKKGPAEYRNMANRKIDAAFNEYLERQGIKPEPKGARKKPAKNDPLLGLAKMKEASAASEVVPQIPAYQPKRSLSEQELFNLQQQEYAQFPNHKEPILIYNRGKGSGYSQRIQAQNLTDSQLDDALDYAQATMKMQSSKPHEKTRARQEEKTIIEEKMRREMRKAQNLPEDWTGGQPDLDSMTRDQLGELIVNGDDNDPVVMEAANRLMQPEQAPIMTAPQARQRLSISEDGRAMRGYNRGNLGADLHSIPDEILAPENKELVSDFAQAKALVDAAEYRQEQVGKQIYEMFGDGQNPVKLGKLQVNPPKTERRLTLEGQTAKDKARDEFADFVDRLKGSQLRTTMGNSPAQYVDVPQVPRDLGAASAMLAHVTEEAKAAKTNYDAMKGPVGQVVQEAHARLTSLSPDAHFSASVPVQLADGRTIHANVEHVNQRMERVFAQEAFEKAAKKDPTLQPEAFFAEWEKARAEATGLEPRPTAQVIAESSNNLQNYKAAIAQIDAAHGYDKTVPGSIVKARAVLPIATSISAYFEGAPAQAADGSEQENNAMPITTALAALTAAGIGAGVIKKYGAKNIANFLGSRLGFVSNLYRDTLDHVQLLDNALGLKPEDGLYRKTWERMSGAIRAGWGVSFDSPEQKAIALGLLKDKLVSPVEALQGRPGTLFETMSQAQRQAVVGGYLNQKALLAEVRNYRKQLTAAIAGKQIDEKKIRSSVYALNFLENQLSPSDREGSELRDFFAARTANAFDYLFALNPKFHALNLSDSFIAGGSKVGPLRVARAWQLMATDNEIQALMSDSGLVGSFRAEQAQQTVNANRTSLMPDLRKVDIPSDRINANRVFLAAMLEHFGDDADKVKSFLRGRLPEDQTVDAFISGMETTSRTLGVDPFRVNTDIISRWKQAPAFGVFVKQPARIARLATNYIAKGEFGKLGKLLFITAAIGGSAAIPEDVKAVWKNYNAESYFTAQRALDELNIMRRLTGFDASDKVSWALFFPLLTSLSPVVETAQKMPEKITKTLEALETVGQWSMSPQQMSGMGLDKERKQLTQALTSLYSDFAMIFASRLWKGIPASWLVKGARAGQEMEAGSMPVWMYERGATKPFAPREEVPLDQTGFGELTPILDKLVPGKVNAVKDRYNDKLEQVMLKKERKKDLLRGLATK